MKLIIFGSTGKVGEHLTHQALLAGHYVTAFTRNPEKITSDHHFLKTVTGDIWDYESVKNAISGNDVVFCTIGAGRKGVVRAATTWNIVKAMKELNVNRFICQTSLGCGESWGNLNFFWKRIMFGWYLKEAIKDHNNQERIVFESDLNWTIVRPSAFTNGLLTNSFRVNFGPDDRQLKLKISKQDVAYFMLSQINNPEFNRKAISISC
ncbi:NAD(P)-dependent oxidoreductase [Bizionia paragorgiae]|uniref:NAD(P)-dependent oxidoreductase n=1 Tax=Bizionia paragorgiae TaxID=283786 RepID=UPI003A900ACB